jgi:hypothetical protein
MRVRTFTFVLSIFLGASFSVNAQRLKAEKDKEAKISSVELTFMAQTPGPMMFFDARRHGMFGLSVSPKIMGAIWNPSLRGIFDESNLHRIKTIKKAGYTPVQYTYLEGRPTAIVRKSDDKDAKRLYLWPLGPNNQPIGRRPTYFARASQCGGNDLSSSLKYLYDSESSVRGYLSQLNCSRGEAIEFSYVALDTAGKVIFEKKVRASEEYRQHEGQLVIANEDKAYYALIHKGNKGKFSQFNGFYEITKDGAVFYSLDIDGYVLRDYVMHMGSDGNVYFRGLVSSKIGGDLIGAATIRFNPGRGAIDDIKVESFDGEALAASIIEKKRIKPKDVEKDAPATEYILSQTHRDRNGNIYLFAQNMEVVSKRFMQISSGTEAVVKHYIYRDIMLIKMLPDGKIQFTEVIPSSNVYTNFTPTKGFSFLFHQDNLYVLHPSYNGDLADFDIESSSVNQPHTLGTGNKVLTASKIDARGEFDSRDVYDFSREEMIFDPGHVLFDGANETIFILARNAKKRRLVTQMKIALGSKKRPGAEE